MGVFSTTAGIRLAKKLDENEAKHKAKKEQQKKNAESVADRTLLPNVLEKDLIAVLGKDNKDLVIDYKKRVMDFMDYKGYGYSDYIYNVRLELFTHTKFGRLDRSVAPNMDVVAIPKTNEKSNDVELSHENKSIENVESLHENKSIENVESLHEDLVNKLSLKDYLKLYRMMSDYLG